MSAQDLAAAVRDRRWELDLSQEALARYGGPSHQIVRNIERAITADYRESTLWKLDRALQWSPGSAGALLRAGVPPTPVATAARRPQLVAEAPVAADDELALRLGRLVLAYLRSEGAAA